MGVIKRRHRTAAAASSWFARSGQRPWDLLLFAVSFLALFPSLFHLIFETGSHDVILAGLGLLIDQAGLEFTESWG